jgi:tetratricopeptide (TPR) repeat protein
VFEVGELPDGRPFLAMKLIKGKTLDELIVARPDPSADRGRLLATFEQVCQAVGYAHAHGVIHRDLKPQNVMVGAFGEVQAMDWGLAKVLAGGRDQPGRPGADTEATLGTEIRPTRDEAEATQAGSLLGTPAYMPPEQAIGAVDEVDARSDVFGLGAILCVVLTGQPPYAGGDSESTRKLAARAKLDDALARLAGCGAEPDLVALCRRCLSPEKADRPADAGAVADAVQALRAEAEDRARRAEVDRAAAEVRAAEERKRRRVLLALAASFLTLVAVAGGGGWYVQKQVADRERQERAARQEAAIRAERARLGVEQALAKLPDLYRRGLWDHAEAALDKTATFLDSDADPDLHARVERASRDTAFLRQLDEIRLANTVGVPLYSGGRPLPRYEAEFRSAGFDVAAGDVAGPARWVNDSPVREFVLAALDDWAYREADPATRDRLLAVTVAATGHGWRAALRDAWPDADRLAAAYDGIPPGQLTPAVTMAVCGQLEKLGRDPVRRLEAGLWRHPGDFWLHLAIANAGVGSDEHAARRIWANRAALSVRPGTVVVLSNLGVAYHRAGDNDNAIAAYREAIRLDPEWAAAYENLGLALSVSGRPAEALRVTTEGLRRNPAWSDNPRNDLRYQAGRFAAQCADGKGDGAPPPAERPAYRREALDHLTTALAATRKLAAADRPFVRERMRGWLADPDLASVRERASLERLPIDEQVGWVKLWTAVRDLRDATAPPEQAPPPRPGRE